MPATAARTRWLAVPIVALSVVGLAACGGGSGSTTDTSSAATPSGAASADAGGEPAGMAAFKQCMSEHGVTMPERHGGGPGGAGGGPGGPPPSGAQGVPGVPGVPGAPGATASGTSGGSGAGLGGGAGHAGGPGGMHHDPTKAPPGVDQNTWTTARTACATLAPTPPTAPAN